MREFIAALLATQFGICLFLALLVLGFKIIGWEPDGLD